MKNKRHAAGGSPLRSPVDRLVRKRRVTARKFRDQSEQVKRSWYKDTLLFVDMVGSCKYKTVEDPSIWLDRLVDFTELVEMEVRKIKNAEPLKRLGDGVLSVFVCPREKNRVEEAVHCAAGIRKFLRGRLEQSELQPKPMDGASTPSAKFVIVHGKVWYRSNAAGFAAKSKYDSLDPQGQAVDTLFRVEGIAERDEILTDAATYNALGRPGNRDWFSMGTFDFKNLGIQEVFRYAEEVGQERILALRKNIRAVAVDQAERIKKLRDVLVEEIPCFSERAVVLALLAAAGAQRLTKRKLLELSCAPERSLDQLGTQWVEQFGIPPFVRLGQRCDETLFKEAQALVFKVDGLDAGEDEILGAAVDEWIRAILLVSEGGDHHPPALAAGN